MCTGFTLQSFQGTTHFLFPAFLPAKVKHSDGFDFISATTHYQTLQQYADGSTPLLDQFQNNDQVFQFPTTACLRFEES